jgi:glyoxylase-like metal-dependent hydrolase (beta-lactamase superfamily II)
VVGTPAPRPVPDLGIGPEVVPGEPMTIMSGVLRLTASNPGIMTGPGTNTYLVGGARRAVIDPGPLAPDHLDKIVGAVPDGCSIGWVLVTHHHRDHAPAARALCERSGAELVAFGHAEGVDPDRSVTDGFVLQGPDFSLRALHTPGHASDHLCWLHEEHSMLFSGDHVMQGSTVVIRPPDGNMAVYLQSLERLLALEPPLRSIAPGHGRVIGDPGAVITSILRHRLEREERVLAALRGAGRTTVDELLPTVYDDVDEKLIPVARHSLWAHLQKLGLDGHARVLGPEPDPLLAGVDASWEPVLREAPDRRAPRRERVRP